MKSVLIMSAPPWFLYGSFMDTAPHAPQQNNQRAFLYLNSRLEMSRAAALTTITILNGLHGDRNVDEVCVVLLRVVMVPVRLVYGCRTERVKGGWRSTDNCEI